MPLTAAGQPSSPTVTEDATRIVQHGRNEVAISGKPQRLGDAQLAAMVRRGRTRSPLEIGQAQGEHHGAGNASLCRQIAGGQQHPTGRLEGIMHALGLGSNVLPERVCRPLRSQRSQHRLPDGLARCREIACQLAAGIASTVEVHTAARLLLPVIWCRAVRIQVRDDPLPEQLHGCRISLSCELNQGRRYLASVLGPNSCGQRFDRRRDHVSMLGAEPSIGKRLRHGRKPRLKRLAGERTTRAEPIDGASEVLGRTVGAAQISQDETGQTAQSESAGNIAFGDLGQQLNLRRVQPVLLLFYGP
ncbi:MAG: hypothetical protein ABI140_20455 [Jatrophihabitantaceae bacterium]